MPISVGRSATATTALHELTTSTNAERTAAAREALVDVEIAAADTVTRAAQDPADLDFLLDVLGLTDRAGQIQA